MSKANKTKNRIFLSNKNNKKAFGDAISTLIMFIAVISITTGLVLVFKNYVGTTQDSFTVQNKLTSNKLRSAITIPNIYFNTSSNLTYIYVKNIGEVDLNTENFDIFVDNAYITNVNAYYADNQSKAQNTITGQDTTVLIKQINLTSGTHQVKVVTEYSTYAEDSFNN